MFAHRPPPIVRVHEYACPCITCKLAHALGDPPAKLAIIRAILPPLGGGGIPPSPQKRTPVGVPAVENVNESGEVQPSGACGRVQEGAAH